MRREDPRHANPLVSIADVLGLLAAPIASAEQNICAMGTPVTQIYASLIFSSSCTAPRPRPW